MSNPKEPIKVLVDIIQTVLGLQPGQVMLAFQKYDIPTQGLFVLLNYQGPAKTISNVSTSAPSSGGMQETQSITKRYLITVDVMSFGDDARLAKELVEMALNGVYAEQQMEANSMQIARMGTGWLDVSSLEETEYMNRLTMTIAVTACYQVQYPVGDYYTDFTRAVPPTVVENA